MLKTEFKLAIIGVLENALNQYLQLDPDSQQMLAKMEGKCLAIELKGLDITLYLLVDTKGIQIFSDFPETPDATLSGTPMELFGLALEKQPGPATFTDGVKISGDTGLGQSFKRLFDSLDIDWEEHVSRYTGDIVAHKLGNLFRMGVDWQQQASDIIRQDISEYLLQEDQLVPEKTELEAFYSQIDTLRDDTERLQVRIQRLKSRLSDS
ncbi:MAG: SCP2 sterol-binding domain-containing protein [Gammaproteobacteria bacterium]